VTSLPTLLADVRACTLCASHLPLEPRPIIQLHHSARILIASQAPGRKAHLSGIPFNDPSGDRLRTWLGMSRDVFYDATRVAILPMGFCFPGTGTSGDLAPRMECAPAWRTALLSRLTQLEVTLVIGQYAMAYHLPGAGASVTEVVRGWEKHWPNVVPLPHPSPRNSRWLVQNPWFALDVLPRLQARVAALIGRTR
jgi:uracil-DNA glycosylase